MTYNRLCIGMPEPHPSSKFPWMKPDFESVDCLDWRNNISSRNKISKKKSIIEFGLEYLERNFCDLNQVICFPPMRIDKEMGALCISQLLFNLFKETLKEGIRAVLSDYDLYYHATLLNCEPKGHIVRKSVNRVVAFYSKTNLIFIVRVASSLDCISQESQNVSADVKYFVSVNKPLIVDEALTVLGVVACPSVERKDLKEKLNFQFSCKFKLFKNLFICKDELSSIKTLHSWWRNKFCGYSKKNSQVNNELLFKKLIALTILIIAKRDEDLPTLKSDTQKQIKSMILNSEQLSARDDSELKKIITGGFGCGKSVIGREIVKNWYLKASKSQETSTMYYICCDHFSLLQCEMKLYVDSLMKDSNINVTIVCDNLLQLWQGMLENKENSKVEKVSLPKLLQYYGGSGTSSGSVNFVLDELSGEYVKEEDTNQLKKMYSSILKESLVVFIPKSIEINRYLYVNDQKQLMDSNCFHEEKIGMKNISLKSSMRVTKCIQVLIDSVQETISKSKSCFYQPNSGLDQMSRTNSGCEEESISNTETECVCMSGVGAQDAINKSNSVLNKQQTNSNFHALHCTTQKDHTSKIQPKDDAASARDYYDDDLDQMAKIVSNLPNFVASNNWMESQCLFRCSVLGHSIVGVKPKVVFLPSLNLTEESSAKVLSIVLEKICFAIVGTTSVICNSMQEVQLVSYAIDIIESYKAVVYTPYLQKYSPTMEEKINVTKKIKKSTFNVLVTDIRAFCGVESEIVLAFVKPEEYYLKHFISDVCARPNSYLTLLVLPSENQMIQKDGTIAEVLNNLSEDIVETIQVNVSNDGNELCGMTGCSFNINNQHKEFECRGAKKNFNKHIKKERFKLFNEDNLM